MKRRENNFTKKEILKLLNIKPMITSEIYKELRKSFGIENKKGIIKHLRELQEKQLIKQDKSTFKYYFIKDNLAFIKDIRKAEKIKYYKEKIKNYQEMIRVLEWPKKWNIFYW